MATKKKQSTSAKRTAGGKVRPTKKHARKGRTPEKSANILGVEEAGEREEREVRSHEVPEDDVPGEYLDQE